MPEKPPSNPPPPDIIFVSPEDDDSEWTPEILGSVLELRSKLKTFLSLPENPDDTIPTFNAPVFFKRLGMAKDNEDGVLMTSRLAEAERDLAKGKTPVSMSPDQMIKIYTEMISSFERNRKNPK